MRALRSTLGLLACAALALPAQAQLAEGGAQRLGLGRAGSALGGSVWGHANPAAWAGLDARVVGLQASQAFELSELRLASLSAASPTPVGTVALAARTYGFEQHRDTRVEVGLGRAVKLSRSRSLDAGLAVGVESASTEGFSGSTTLTLSAGIQGEVVRGVRVGLAGRNLLGIVQSVESDLDRPVSTIPQLTVGVAYAPSETATVVVDAEQDLDFGLSVRGGVEVRPVAALALRVGAGTIPTRDAGSAGAWYSAGLGVRSGPLAADLAVERHDALGLTPAVGVRVSF